MYRILKCFIVFGSLVLFSSCEKTNQSQLESLEKSDSKYSLEKLKLAISELNAAIINKDGQVLKEITSEDLSYGHSSGAIQNKDEFVNDVLGGPFSFLSISSENEEYKLFENFGIVRSVFIGSGVNNDEQVELRIGVVQVFQIDSNREWKLLLRQGFKL